MPSIKFSVPHKLGAVEAKRRIANLIGQTRTQFGDKVTDVNERWIADRGEFSFKAMGFPISGVLEVKSDAVDGELNLPFAALPFKSRIEAELSGKARELLA